MTVALGFALSGVPNVELMTMTVFIAGHLLGWRAGVVVGGASIAAYSLFNPLGAAMPPLLIGQMVGFAIIGAAGALTGPVIVRLKPRWMAFLVCGLVGFLLTFVYDVITNIGAYFTITGDQAPSSLVKFVGAGVLFMVMHIVWNTALFLVVLNPVLTVLAKYRLELSEGR
jgi:hypothetical protein